MSEEWPPSSRRGAITSGGEGEEHGRGGRGGRAGVIVCSNTAICAWCCWRWWRAAQPRVRVDQGDRGRRHPACTCRARGDLPHADAAGRTGFREPLTTGNGRKSFTVSPWREGELQSINGWLTSFWRAWRAPAASIIGTANLAEGIYDAMNRLRSLLRNSNVIRAPISRPQQVGASTPR